MNENKGGGHFGAQQASSYDDKRAKMAAMKDALHLFLGAVFSDLPDDARILCVGAGTGAELIYLAGIRPKWQFAVVEPSPQMMTACRQKSEALGISSRCVFHEGYLASYAETGPFDAATSILVSQFMLQREERVAFFRQIADRLAPGGLLVSADLAAETGGSEYQSQVKVWLDMHKMAGINMTGDYLGRDVAVTSPDEMAAILEAGGFVDPVQFYQGLLIRAWFSRKAG